MKYIGAIDLGTSSTRFIVFSHEGEIVASAQQEHRQIHPEPGWVEHDPLEIWRNTTQVIETALARADISARDLVAVGLTNQRETTVLWDRHTGQPLHNAIVWQDTRVADLVSEHARSQGQDCFRTKTGLPLATYFSAPKLQWLLNHVSGARARAEAGDALFGTVDTWVMWNLTGGTHSGLHITDVTNASRTQLMNLNTLEWDSELLEAFQIPRACLPGIVSSSEVYAEGTIPALAGVKVAGILGDQQAALVGQICLRSGDAKNTYGTGCFLLMNTGTDPVQSKAGLITTVAYQFGKEAPRYALEGSIAVAGALVQWLRDGIGLIRHSGEIESLAREVVDNGGVYLVPAFSGLYAPHWNAGARGIIAGLTSYAKRGHIARAAIEATAYQTRDVLAAMHEDCGTNITELRVDGGMVVNEMLMQFQADILEVPVTRPRIQETTALGAAYAAGLAVGYWDRLDELRDNCRMGRRWEPQMSSRRRNQLYGSWKRAVSRALDWIADEV